MAGSDICRLRTPEDLKAPVDEAISVDASTDVRYREELDEPSEVCMRMQDHKISMHEVRHIREAMLEAGYALGNRFDLHENCHVHLARSIATDRDVVAKVIVDRLISSSSALVRFQLEAHELAEFSHPNLVRVEDYGSVANVHYMILECADGINLATHVLRSGPLAPILAISCVTQAAQALAYLHERGVIHRDVKPANLVLSPEGQVTLMDLGMARMSDGSAGSITRLFDDTLLGTADYMSPEQAQDCHKIDARSDIYSLGCTLYFLLAGRAPFFGDTLAARLMEHQNSTPPDLAQGESHARLAALCVRMMAKLPADRIQSAAEVVDELSKCVA